MLQIQSTQTEASQAVQALAEVASVAHNMNSATHVSVDINGEAVATLNQNGQLILTGQDGSQSLFLGGCRFGMNGTSGCLTELIWLFQLFPCRGW